MMSGRSIMPGWRLAALMALCLPAAASAQQAGRSTCGNPFQNHYGPFDYRRASPDQLLIVERRHLTPGVMSLTEPGTTSLHELAADVGYTLHVFPNHHKALVTMVRLGERHKSPQPPGAKFTIDCYFQRALMYAKDDWLVRVIYASYLGQVGRKAEALVQLEVVLPLVDNPMTHTTLGEIYLDMGEYERALAQAHRAAALGDPRKRLEQALRDKGVWREPGSAAAAADAAASAASTASAP